MEIRPEGRESGFYSGVSDAVSLVPHLCLQLLEEVLDEDHLARVVSAADSSLPAECAKYLRVREVPRP